MLHTLWSVKGGSGVTVLSGAFASVLADRSGRAVVVDLRGDQPAALGLAEPAGPGVRDWLCSTTGSAEALERLLVDVGGGVALVPRGTGDGWPRERGAELVTALRTLGCAVVVDAGTLDPDAASAELIELAATVGAAGSSLLVTRACYLALRRATRLDLPADGAVLIEEVGRPLGQREVEQVLGVPVLAVLRWDPSVARAVDAGLLVRRVRRAYRSALEGVT